MYLYLFEIYGKIEAVDEKTAHNFLRNPSGGRQPVMKYLGAIQEIKRSQIIKDITKEKHIKFGAIGIGEENDALIIESRIFTEHLITEKMNELVKEADIKIQPRTLDYMLMVGTNADGAQGVSSMKEAVQRLQQMR